MQPNRSSKQFDSRQGLCRPLLSFGLPALLLLAFLGTQFINLDSIGWSDGFNHPLTGWDHLLTMLAVGIWAAQLRGQAVWMLPLAFVGVMSLGGLAGAAGLAIPSVEGIILLSGAVFSVLITRKVRFSAKINVLIVAFFAFFHGFAHGQEISASASLISYTLGFMLATLLLHGAGILVAKLLVFSITCLLTVIFSSAAMAKTAESIIDIEDKNTAIAQGPVFGKIPPFGMATGQFGYENGYVAIAVDDLDSEDFSRHGIGGSGRSAATCGAVSSGSADSLKTPPKNYSEDIKTDLDSDGLILKQASFQALDCWQEKCLLSPDYISHSRFDFKRYYPDINHTPGKQLLSNGVGLTSPPSVIRHVLAPQASPHFCNTAFPSIEEPHLQLIFAKFDTGNSFSRIHNDNRGWDCVSNDQNQLQANAEATVNFSKNLIPIGHLDLLGRIVAVSDFNLYSPHLFRKTCPWAICKFAHTGFNFPI